MRIKKGLILVKMIPPSLGRGKKYLPMKCDLFLLYFTTVISENLLYFVYFFIFAEVFFYKIKVVCFLTIINLRMSFFALSPRNIDSSSKNKPQIGPGAYDSLYNSKKS